MKSKRKPTIVLQRTFFGPPRIKYIRGIWAQSRKRAQKADIQFTIKPEDVEQLYVDQNGHCDVTGLAFSFESIPGAFVPYPFAPSIDRRDSSGGYTSDNVRLVCTAVNFGMGEWGQELYLRLARAAVAKADLKS